MFNVGDKVRFQHLGQDVIGEVSKLKYSKAFDVYFQTPVHIFENESYASTRWEFNQKGEITGSCERYGTVLTKIEDKMEIKLDKNYWQVSNKYYSLVDGNTTILNIDDTISWPVETTLGRFNLQGRFQKYENRTLFYKEAITFDEKGRPIAINWNYVPPHLNKPIFNHTKHKEMWNMLAKGVIVEKTDYFHPSSEIPKNECFACETTVIAEGFLNCDKCPFGQFEKFTCLKGLFDTWVRTSGEARKVIAKAIADYPLCETNSKLYNII